MMGNGPTHCILKTIFLRSLPRCRNVTFFDLAWSQRANFCKTGQFLISYCITNASFPFALCWSLSFTACQSQTQLKAFHFTSEADVVLKLSSFIYLFIFQATSKMRPWCLRVQLCVRLAQQMKHLPVPVCKQALLVYGNLDQNFCVFFFLLLFCISYYISSQFIALLWKPVFARSFLTFFALVVILLWFFLCSLPYPPSLWIEQISTAFISSKRWAKKVQNIFFCPFFQEVTQG